MHNLYVAEYLQFGASMQFGTYCYVLIRVMDITLLFSIAVV